MVKTLLKAFLGILFTAAGMFFSYMVLKSLNTGFNYLYLFLTILFVTLGVIVLAKASKSYQWVSTVETDTEEVGPVEKHKSIIEQNRELANDWANTNLVRDRLKLLKAEGAAQES